MKYCILSLFICLVTTPLSAGLYYSQEKLAELPAQWRGFLVDLRNVRSIASAGSATTAPTAWRQEYLAAETIFKQKQAQGELTADEVADFGAVLLRLGKVEAAVAILKPAATKHPKHFAVQANLGTAWQMYGQLDKAFEQIRLSVRLAPETLKPFEEFHLKWIRSRLLAKDDQALDSLFDLKWEDETGKYYKGNLPKAVREKLPKNTIALMQQLLFWFPADGRLLWQLGEISAVYGDLGTAEMLMDLCIGEMGMAQPSLRNHRQALVAELVRPSLPSEQKSIHSLHTGDVKIAFKSKRLLLPRPYNTKNLPAIRPGQSHYLPWQLLAETSIDTRKFTLGFHDYVKKLSGEKVILTGYMQPLTDDIDCTSFLFVENPVGCWYCELPDATGIVFVELEPGKIVRYDRGFQRIEGVLKLNPGDPEDFYFSLTKAKMLVGD